MESLTVLTLLKYSAGALTAFYGVYATVTDFKKKRGDGTEVLSYRGWIGIGVLAVASTLSLSSDFFRDRQEQKDKKAAREAEQTRDEQTRSEEAAIIADLGRQLDFSRQVVGKLDKASAAIQATSQTTKAVFGNSERAVNPIRDVRLTYWVDVVDESPAIRSYVTRVRERIEREVASGRADSPLYFVTQRSRLSNGSESIDEVQLRDELLPDRATEPVAYYAFGYFDVALRFFLQPLTPAEIARTNREADLWMSVGSGVNPQGLDGPHQLAYSRRNGWLRLHALQVPSNPTFWRSNGAILGIPDLSKSQLVVSTRPVMGSSSDADRAAVAEVRRGFKLTTLVLTMTDGREFRMRGDDIHAVADGVPINSTYTIELSKLHINDKP